MKKNRRGREAMLQEALKRRRALEREVARYKHRVEVQHSEIMRLHGEAKGWKELCQAGDAVAAAVLYAVEADESDPVTVDREVIKDALGGKYRARTEPTEDKQYFKVFCAEM